MAYLGSAMRRIHDLSRSSQFLLFFLAPSCFSLGAFQMIPLGDHPSLVREGMMFLSLYFFSLVTVGVCFYFVQGVKGLTAYLVEKQRLARKRQS